MACSLALSAHGAPSRASDPPALRPDDATMKDRSTRATEGQAKLDSSAARSARAQSRTQHAGLDPQAALQLARRAFPDMMDADLPSGRSLATDLRVIRRPSAKVAIVQRKDTDERLLAISSFPLQAADEQGAAAPLDLTLHTRGDSFKPANPLADVTIGRSEPRITLPSADVRVALSDREGHAEPAILSRGRAFFADAHVDTDAVILPTPGGAEASWQLRSQDSPERLSLSFDLPAGGVLRRARSERPIPGDPPQSYEIAVEDRAVAYIAAPVAFDSEGSPVDVEVAKSGRDVLTLTVAHRGRDLHYPLLVDPEVIVAGIPGQTASAGYPGWGFIQNLIGGSYGFGVTANDPAYGNGGMYVSMPTNSWFRPNAIGMWYFQAPPNTYLYRAIFNNWTHVPTFWYRNDGTCCANYSAVFNGVIDGAGSAWEPNVNYANGSGAIGANPVWANYGLAGIYTDFCYVPRCTATPSPAIGDRNFATFGLQAFNPYNTNDIGTLSNRAFASVQYTAVFLGDQHPPTLASPPASRGWTNDPDHVIPLTFHDAGLGVTEIRMNGASAGGVVSFPCTGDPYSSPCPLDSDPSDEMAYTLPDGVNQPTLVARDVVGNTGTPLGGWTEKIDTQAPAVLLSGSLKDLAGKRAPDGSYALQVSATDMGAAQTSGVKEITIKVDGQTQSIKSNAAGGCDGCPLTHVWSLRTDRYGAGQHTIEVAVTDYATNVAPTQRFTLDIARAAMADIGPGSANLLSGNFRVSRNDVSVESFNSKLEVSRAYNSRAASVMDPNGAFGPGWVASLPVDCANSEYVALVDTADAGGDGTVSITSADGLAVSFARSGSSYTSPAGFEAVTLVKTGTASFELRDSGGNITVFTKPQGTSGYRPTSIRQPSSSGGQTTTTVTYEVVTVAGEQVTRPIEIAAPPPMGVATKNFGSPAAPGTRSLSFEYGSSADQLASGDTPTGWGAYVGRLKRIDFTAYDPQNGSLTTTAVEQYLYDTAGRLREAWDPRTGLKETYDYDTNGLMTKLAPAGEEPWTLSYDAVTPSAPTFGRLVATSRASLDATAPTAIWRLDYGVAVSGTGAPYQMSAADVSRWGQQGAAPASATALFEPDETAAAHATVYYLDAFGRSVNVAAPGGRISSAKYDEHDNVVRELSAANRVQALAGSDPAALSSVLDTQRVYSPDGTMLLDEYGPQHAVRLPDGTTASARRHTHIAYDQGAPANGGPYRLPTTTTIGAYVPGRAESDVRTTKTEYDWVLRKPTMQITDPSGLNLRNVTRYDGPTGLLLEFRMPANPAGGDAHATAIVYYSAAANTSYPECGEKPWWANLACQVRPVTQPLTTGAPPIPVTTYTYNRLSQILTKTDVAGAATRTTSYSYDVAGRLTGTSISASEGATLPAITYAYDPATGRLRTTSAAGATISRTYDALGRLSAYTDADSNTASTSYDLRGRIAVTSNAKGSQVYTYDPSTADLTALRDSALGVIAATYDADGRIVAQTLASGLSKRTTFDEDGAPTRLSYVKSAGCTSNCTVYDDVVIPSIHGQSVAQTSSASQQAYVYDAAGRLTQVSDTRAGQCTVRDYAYDADSNRIRLTRHDPAFLVGSCTPTSAGAVTSYSYDAADRLITGEVYDNFGRTTTVPAANAGGTAMTNTYYANDMVASLTQGTSSQTYQLDPLRRIRSTTRQTTSGGIFGIGATTTAVTAIQHYDDGSDSPSWMTEDASGLAWSRNIVGIDGDLVAIQDHMGTIKAQISNLHDDVVATAGNDAAATTSAIREASEFGTPPDANSDTRYQWLGAKQRSSALPSGVVLMGQRVYNPYSGRFLQVDPVPGGSANAYDYVNQDPGNEFDLDGTCTLQTKCTLPFGCTLQCVQSKKKKQKRLVGCVLRCNQRCPTGHPLAGDHAVSDTTATGANKEQCLKNAREIAKRKVYPGCTLKHCHEIPRVDPNRRGPGDRGDYVA